MLLLMRRVGEALRIGTSTIIEVLDTVDDQVTLIIRTDGEEPHHQSTTEKLED